jgi:hypothetical protein
MVLARFLRLLAMFLFVMAALAAFEWVIAAAFVDWPYRLVNLDYYGDIRVVYHPPLPQILIYLPCPGNGYGSLCGPWALFLIFTTLLVSAVCLIVNLLHARAYSGIYSDGSVLDRPPTRYLSVGASLALVIGLLWTWSIPYAPLSWGLPTGTPLMVEVVSSLVTPLFILVCAATGWRLWRAYSPG